MKDACDIGSQDTGDTRTKLNGVDLKAFMIANNRPRNMHHAILSKFNGVTVLNFAYGNSLYDFASPMTMLTSCLHIHWMARVITAHGNPNSLTTQT